MIERVTIRDFKSHQYSDIPIPSGLSAISGENYAGKSSIVQAIGWALFDASPGSQTAFVRHGAKKARIAVDLRSPLDQKSYRITRQIGSSTLWHIEDLSTRERLVDKKEQVIPWLRHHLQMTSSVELQTLYKEAVGVPQGQLISTFKKTPAERRKHFDAILGLSDYEEARKLLWGNSGSRDKGAGEVIHRELQAIEKQVVRLEGETSEYDAYVKAIAESEALLEALNQDAQRGESQLSALQEQEREWAALKEQLTTQQATLDSLEQALASAHESLLERAKSLTLAREAASLCEANQSAYDDYLAARVALQESEAQITALADEKEQRSRLQERLASWKEQLTKREAECQVAAHAQAQADALTPSVQQEEALLQQKQALETQLEERANVEADYEQLSTKRDGLEALIAQQQSDIDELNEEVGPTANVETLAAEAHSALVCAIEAEAMLKVWEPSPSPAPNLCPLLREPCLNMQQKQQELQAVFAEEKEALAQQADTQRSLYESLQEQLQTAREKEQQLSQLPLYQERLAQTHRQAQALDSRLEQIEQALEEHKRAEGVLEGVDASLAALQPSPKEQQTQFLLDAARLGALEEERHSLQEQVSTCEEELVALEEQLAPLLGLEQALVQSREAMKALEEGYQTFLSHQQQAEALASCEQAHQRLCAQIELQEQEQKQSAEALAALQSSYQADAHEALLLRTNALSQEVAALLGRREEVAASLTRQHDHLEGLKAKKKLLAAKEEEQALWQQRKDTLTWFRQKLREAGPEMAVRTRSQLESQAQQIFSELVDDPSVHLQLSDSYGLQLTYDSFTREYEALAGSEGIMAALAVRLALLSLASSLQFAIFDEPTVHLDKEHRMKLAEQLCRLQSIAQLIVISHDDSFESNVDHTIFVTKVEGVSQVEVD